MAVRLSASLISPALLLIVLLLFDASGGGRAARLDRWDSSIRMPTEKDEPEDPDKELGTRWAVLVAGSSSYGNYRHQADVCHAYQLLKKGGLKEENIILFMYDDIAAHPLNPRPGIIINHPQGDDVYAGVPKKTRIVMECLHRFCRECIDKSMRMGNSECPACWTHCASRRSLRDDPNYDALIAALYPDIDKYEEEIQASIAQTFRRQAEALGKRRSTAKATAVAFVRRSRGYRNAHLRGRRNYRNAAESQGSDENEDANGNDGGKDSSSVDEHTEVRPKRSKRWGGARFPQASLAAAAADGGGDENDSEVNKESLGASVGLVSSSERLAWGKGGMWSHTRYGSMSGGNGKSARNSRLSKLVDYLRIIDKNADECFW